jgi:GT2 family glycosyltransferase
LRKDLAAAKLGAGQKQKVSIVIPYYNGKNTVEKIVEAVRTSPVEGKKIIVVDDCSQEGASQGNGKLSLIVD